MYQDFKNTKAKNPSRNELTISLGYRSTVMAAFRDRFLSSPLRNGSDFSRSTFSDYVTAVKASDASMKCSTCRDYHCRDCVKCLRIASTWGDILYHASRNKRHESSRDRDISQLVHRFMKIFPSQTK